MDLRARRRVLRVALVALVLPGMPGCGPSPGPAAIRFVRVELPNGAIPQVMVAAGRELVIGVHYNGQPRRPGLVRLGPGGTTTELAVVPARSHDHPASW